MTGMQGMQIKIALFFQTWLNGVNSWMNGFNDNVQNVLIFWTCELSTSNNKKSFNDLRYTNEKLLNRIVS